MHKKKTRITKVIMLLIMTLILSMSYNVIAKEKYHAAQGIVISADESSRRIVLLPTGKQNKPENYLTLTLAPNAVIRFEQGQQAATFAALRPGAVIKVSYKHQVPSTPAQGMVDYITILGSKKSQTIVTPPPVVTETPQVTVQPVPEETTTAPVVTEKPQETTTQLAVEETSTEPVVTEAPQETTTQPVVEETTTVPVITEAPQETITQPAAEETTTVPVVTEKPEETTTQPVPEETTTVPVVTEKPEKTTTQPVPEETTTAPVKKKTSPQIVKDYTIKDVCIVKVLKKKKAILVAPTDALSDESKHIIVHVKDDTKIIRLKGNKICRFKDLRRGQKLNILTDGIIIPSKPQETTAVGIMILNR